MTFVPPPGYQPIYNPSIPYIGPILGGLRPEMSIYIQGAVPEGITRFHIDLQCGDFEGADVAFHFNPRFDFWDKVVFNTFREGVWEGEEKIKKMPFKRGEHFEMVIVVNSEGYQVNVNGKEFYFYQHRIPVERVCVLGIGGDVFIQTINVIGTVPYSNMIPGGMSGKRTIVVRGMVPYGAQRFAVNFVVGFSRDIAFHLNPRITEGLVIRNSRIGGMWGQEEIEIGINPFMEGQYFDLSIRCGHRRFKIFVNGQHLCNFFHRFEAFTQVDMLEIEGDVQISYIHF
ncbi:Galectin-4 [Triplophysa tibetana]|uniref:Galectin n=1 Tax=Triplophysa tibetana TaxID=1572043 RepID=A0A5A9NYZ9_9TELE|nr:Galectin-4 [Triplophysa tibetana]